MDRLPCASLLVRIVQASKTEDGIKVLCQADVAEHDWEKLGVLVVAPVYGRGLYNTSFCDLRDSEKDLFKLRQQRNDPLVKETAIILMSADNYTDFVIELKFI